MNPNDTPDKLPHKNLVKGKAIEPLNKPESESSTPDSNPSLNIIRNKLDSIYHKDTEVSNKPTAADAEVHRSKHQKFMHELSSSGKSLAEIQTEWYQYYTDLPNEEKNQVWQEFYDSHNKLAKTPSPATETPSHLKPVSPDKLPTEPVSHTTVVPKTTHDIKQELIGKVTARGKIDRKGHLHSLMFGLSAGLVTILIMMFGLFNERFIAPFITPSKNVSATPIIMDPNGTITSKDPKIIIPKINVEIPVVYDEPTIDEAAIQRALEKGTVHYPTTSNPGEVGNGVIFGHSANNILNQGKYKFAFVLLKKLENGDTFYLQKDGKQYAYKVFDKKVVAPTEVSVLYPSFPDKPSTFTLITCDPPGTSLNRLVVTAEQVSPDPTANIASTAKPVTSDPTVIPSNAESLWQRIRNWL